MYINIIIGLCIANFSPLSAQPLGSKGEASSSTEFVLNNISEVQELLSNLEEDEKRNYDEDEIKSLCAKLSLNYSDFNFDTFFALNSKKDNISFNEVLNNVINQHFNKEIILSFIKLSGGKCYLPKSKLCEVLCNTTSLMTKHSWDQLNQINEVPDNLSWFDFMRFCLYVGKIIDVNNLLQRLVTLE